LNFDQLLRSLEILSIIIFLISIWFCVNFR